jgi:hypothetical protein
VIAADSTRRKTTGDRFKEIRDERKTIRGADRNDHDSPMAHPAPH